MAHFARLNDQNIVEEVIVISNDVVNDSPGTESETAGIEFCNMVVGPGKWVQTSYNARFRRFFASPGFGYDEENDCFFEPQPFPSWRLNNNAEWESPVLMPTDGFHYQWDEDLLNWVKVKPPEVVQEEP